PSRSKAALIRLLSSRAVSHCFRGRVLVTIRKVTWESPKLSTPRTCGASRILGPKNWITTQVLYDLIQHRNNPLKIFLVVNAHIDDGARPILSQVANYFDFPVGNEMRHTF